MVSYATFYGHVTAHGESPPGHPAAGQLGFFWTAVSHGLYQPLRGFFVFTEFPGQEFPVGASLRLVMSVEGDAWGYESVELWPEKVTIEFTCRCGRSVFALRVDKRATVLHHTPVCNAYQRLAPQTYLERELARLDVKLGGA